MSPKGSMIILQLATKEQKKRAEDNKREMDAYVEPEPTWD